jgi:hypothetical protein
MHDWESSSLKFTVGIGGLFITTNQIKTTYKANSVENDGIYVFKDKIFW